MNIIGNKFIILILYINDLLVTNGIGLINDIKNYFSKNFKIKNIRNVSYVIGLEILLNNS